LAGTPLLSLHDPSELYLRAEPVGGEVSALLAAVESGAGVRASPLVAGTGPELEDLEVAFLRSGAAAGDPAGAGAGAGAGARAGVGGGGGAGGTAFLAVRNSVLLEQGAAAPGQDPGPGGPRRRTWALRQGQRYVLAVPTEKMEGVWVLPAAAV